MRRPGHPDYAAGAVVRGSGGGFARESGVCARRTAPAAGAFRGATDGGSACGATHAVAACGLRCVYGVCTHLAAGAVHGHRWRWAADSRCVCLWWQAAVIRWRGVGVQAASHGALCLSSVTASWGAHGRRCMAYAPTCLQPRCMTTGGGGPRVAGAYAYDGRLRWYGDVPWCCIAAVGGSTTRRGVRRGTGAQAASLTCLCSRCMVTGGGGPQVADAHACGGRLR